jgi:hypothetical protein
LLRVLVVKNGAKIRSSRSGGDSWPGICHPGKEVALAVVADPV